MAATKDHKFEFFIFYSISQCLRLLACSPNSNIKMFVYCYITIILQAMPQPRMTFYLRRLV